MYVKLCFFSALDWLAVVLCCASLRLLMILSVSNGAQTAIFF